MVSGVPRPPSGAPSRAGVEPARMEIGPAAGGKAGAVAAAVKAVADELAAISTRPWTLMEVCGGQTHAIVRWGLDQLLPAQLRLIHGPGCPVCVTPAATIEQAQRLARRPEVILCSFGDMLRVPGEGQETLLAVRAAGGDVRLLTAPLQALELARSHPHRQVVFLAVGFETTAPATALLARQALTLGIRNLSLLDAHVRVSPAMQAILAEPDNQVEGFLAAGHVCSVLGTAELEQLVNRWRVPVVVTGFEPLELMRGVLACVRQLEAGAARVENAYGSVVRAEGNPAARGLLEEVFVPCDRPWRGLGVMVGGGLELRSPYRALDAATRFGLGEAGSGCAIRGRAATLASAAAAAQATAWTRQAGAEPGQCLPDREGCVPCMITAADAGPNRAAQRSAGPVGWLRSRHDGTPLGSEDGSDPAGSRDSPPVRDGAPAHASRHSQAPEQRCIAGSILRGLATPPQCPAFGTTCTPEQPLGAPMVSSEGACAAYFLYRLRTGIDAEQGD